MLPDAQQGLAAGHVPGPSPARVGYSSPVEMLVDWVRVF
jgi:hypothetical protein